MVTSLRANRSNEKRIRTVPHQQILSVISGHLVAYTDSKHGHLVAGGGTLSMRLNGHDVKRSLILLFDRLAKTLWILAWSLMDQRTLPEALGRAREFFEGIPLLRALVLIKIFPRHTDRRFACVAVLLRRDAQGAATLADAVSFGSASLDQASIYELDSFGNVIIRDLPRVPLPAENQLWLPHDNPWGKHLNPCIAVPGEDAFFKVPRPRSMRATRILIQLWPIFSAAENGNPI